MAYKNNVKDDILVKGTSSADEISNDGSKVTIDGGGKVIFDDVSSSDAFNINGKTYKISGSKLK